MDMNLKKQPEIAAGTQSGAVINIDINSVVYPFLSAVAKLPQITEQDLYPFIDQYAHTHVTDIALDVFCQYSNTPSAFFTDAVHKSRQTTENGVAVDYRKSFGGLPRIEEEFGIDIYGVWFRRCRELGMNAWLSVRMNDCHCPDETVCFLRSDFFYTARENNWMIGSRYGYHRYCYDYAVPEVRSRMLAYIAEQLDRYDVDGLELDFLREIHCFDYLNNPEAVGIMNGFMREVRDIVRRAAEKRGHEIKIMSRLMRDIGQNLVFGFDAKTWIAEKLVDILAISPRWATCDSAMPIGEWKAIAGDTKIYAGIEILLCKQSNKAFVTAEVARGYAAQYLSEGADRMYYYNYFQDPNNRFPEIENIHRTGGEPETIFSLPRRHVVAYQDLCPVGHTPYKPLPVTLPAGGHACVEVHTGHVAQTLRGEVIVGFDGAHEIGSIAVLVNGVRCAPFAEARIESLDGVENKIIENGYVADTVRLYAFPIAAAMPGGIQNVCIENGTNSDITAAYIEIALR